MPINRHHIKKRELLQMDVNLIHSENTFQVLNWCILTSQNDDIKHLLYIKMDDMKAP